MVMKHCTLPLMFGLALLFVTAGAYAKEFKLLNDPTVPAAAGKVNVDKDRNGNYRVKVEVRHLAKPSALNPPKQAYVVWVQSRRDQQPVPLGELRVNDDLDGSLEATTPYDAFDVFITAEDQPATRFPSGPHLLRATVSP
jgi:hypothetical protein